MFSQQDFRFQDFSDGRQDFKLVADPSPSGLRNGPSRYSHHTFIELSRHITRPIQDWNNLPIESIESLPLIYFCQI